MLTSAIEDVVDEHPERPEVIVTGSLQRDHGDLRQMLTSAARLWVHGTDITWPTPAMPSASTLVLPGDDAQNDGATTETQPVPAVDSEPVVLALSAKSEPALRQRAAELADFVGARAEYGLAEVAGVL
ncbi:hypothetical protein DTL70_00020, partial [Streptomyces diacarni]